MKFGGSSLADANHIRTVADIVRDRSRKGKKPPLVVVSAMQGVTDTLLQLTREPGEVSDSTAALRLYKKHRDTAAELLGLSPDTAKLAAELDPILDELKQALKSIDMVHECSERTRDMILGFGERLSSTMFSALLRSLHISSRPVDARKIIRTDNKHGGANVNFRESYKLIHKELAHCPFVPVITGFIASTDDGINTTLGRNGSDYTASLIGAGVKTDCVEIWTDVDGVMTVDPRVVDNAWVIDEISYVEAMELSYFGARVIHPFTIMPAVEINLPIRIKNTLNPSAPGTIIQKHTKNRPREITGIASIDNVSMLTVEGVGMADTPELTQHIFKSIAESGANIIMISQASSQQSICMVCRKTEAREAAHILNRNLYSYIQARVIKHVELIENMEIIAVVGEKMRGKPGLSGKIFDSLGNVGVNVFAIAQGSSELNISFVIKEEQTRTALKAIHKSLIEQTRN